MLASRKTFQAGGAKTKEAIAATEFFHLWLLSLLAKKSSSLEQGGACFLFSQEDVAMLTCSVETSVRAEKTMTATDVTGFDAIFSTGFFVTFSVF